jgi:thiol-disulfide isomerase/thioredoxin
LRADGCPHCQEFEPTFHSASRSEPHVVFGMVNAKYRDLLDRFNVDRFPTVEWVPALSTKAKVAYEGDRTVQDLRRWIRDDGFARDPVGKTQGPRMRHVAEEDRGVFKERPN